MANAQVYRSVKFVLQNNANEALMVQGFCDVVGNWADKMAPTQGEQVLEQSAANWTSISTELGSGTSAYVRLGSSRGYSMVRWNLPWSEPFEHWVDDAPDTRLSIIVERSRPDAIVLLGTFEHAPR